jgi:glycerophosphoryl diester phosphodiesterase
MHDHNHLPLIIAHRGASAVAPENSLAAFQKAIEAGADGIEFDVRIAKDGVPIVFHDSTLKRMARREGRTSNFTSEELGALDLGEWFNAKFPKKADENFSGERVPTLEKLFAFLRGYRGRLYLEMKGSPAETSTLAEAIVKIIKPSEFLPQTIVKSFKLEAIEKIKTLLPEATTAALFAPKILTVLRKQSRVIEQATSFRCIIRWRPKNSSGRQNPRVSRPPSGRRIIRSGCAAQWKSAFTPSSRTIRRGF